MGKISNYTQVSASKLADKLVCDQEDSGVTSTKSVSIEQIGNAVNALQVRSDLDTQAQTIVSAINEIASYTPVYGNTASGAIATFDTSLALPLQDLQIAINAVQEAGTPTPQDSKAITGFTGANIYDKGTNLWNEDWELGNISTSDGQPSSSTLYIRSKVYCACKGGATYYCKSHGTSQLVIYWYSANDTYLGFDVCTNTTKTAPANAVKFKIRCEVTTYSNDISINYPATDTAYHAYNANSTTAISWQTEAGIIYGGYIRIVNGIVKLVATFGYKDLGTLTYQRYEAGGVYYFRSYTITDIKPATAPNPANILCECYDIKTSSTMIEDSISVANGQKIIYIRDDTYTSENALQTALSGMLLVYELETPIEYTLTGIPPIYSIAGTNNVFGDTNGNTSVVYACSLKDYIDSQ